MNATAPKDAGEAYRAHGPNGFRDHVKNSQRPFDPKDRQKNEDVNFHRSNLQENSSTKILLYRQ